MAQIVPSLTSLPLDSTAAPSAEDIQNRLPSICVDYLSHDWAEEDVWASWRSMTRHKNEIANGVRLENASWRTWWKQRNKLRTISPETLNWLKDSDVTWLYGPLHTAVEPVPPPKVATTDDRLGIVRHDKKPILKHRTLSEMLTIPMPSSPILESSMPNNDDVEDMDQGRPHLMHTKSDTNIVRRNMRHVSPPRAGGSGGRTPVSGESSFEQVKEAAANATVKSPGEVSDAGSKDKRHISFNTFVEQCIAVDDPEDIPGASEEDDDDDDEDSEDDVLEIRSLGGSSASSRSSRSSRPSMSRTSSTSSDHVTIAMIAPTMLKSTDAFPSPSPAVVYAPPDEYADHRRRTSASPVENALQAGQYDFPSPVAGGRPASSQWDDGDEYSVGFDYFSGPDLGVGDEYNMQWNQQGPNSRGTAVQSHVGSGPHYGGANNSSGAPTVGQAPQQAKWRSAGNQTNSSSENSSTSSSTASTARPSPAQTPGVDGTVPPSQQQGTQPGRGILKIRPPGSAPAPSAESTSPTSSYFNFNPSAATGFGGMGHRGTHNQREPVSSSLPLYDAVQSPMAGAAPVGATPASAPSGTVTPPVGIAGSYASTSSSPISEGSERGRSATRTAPSTSERSQSRGTTASASNSVSPNSVRSPVQIPTSQLQSGAGGGRYSRAGPVESGAPAKPASANTSPKASSAATSPVTTLPPAAPMNSVAAPQLPAVQKAQDDAAAALNDDERAGTPTPHSSPLITMGKIADTSATSLPHTQSELAAPVISKGPGSAQDAAASAMSAANASASASTSSLKRHYRSPSLPGAGDAPLPRRTSSSSSHPNAGGIGLDDDEGGSMYGRAVNIANTAKDLFGALWGYGAQPPPGSSAAGGPTAQAQAGDRDRSRPANGSESGF